MLYCEKEDNRKMYVRVGITSLYYRLKKKECILLSTLAPLEATLFSQKKFFSPNVTTWFFWHDMLGGGNS